MRTQRRKDILRRTVLVALGIILGSNIYMLNAKAVGQNQMPMPFGIGAAVVQSGSMEPTYSTGDLLFVRASEDYAYGDVVVYQEQNILVVHRIVDINGDMVTTKGDANNAADPAFSSSLIKGKVVGCIPAFGYVIDFLKSPLGILVLIGSAVGLVELSFRRKVKKEDEELQAQDAKYIQEVKDEIEKLRIELGKDDIISISECDGGWSTSTSSGSGSESGSCSGSGCEVGSCEVGGGNASSGTDSGSGNASNNNGSSINNDSYTF